MPRPKDTRNWLGNDYTWTNEYKEIKWLFTYIMSANFGDFQPPSRADGRSVGRSVVILITFWLFDKLITAHWQREGTQSFGEQVQDPGEVLPVGSQGRPGRENLYV